MLNVITSGRTENSSLKCTVFPHESLKNYDFIYFLAIHIRETFGKETDGLTEIDGKAKEQEVDEEEASEEIEVD